jgi:hypothetical protein
VGIPERNLLEIEWVYDDYECETCGPSYAEGAIVRLNNEVILELEPRAHCYSSISYDVEQVYDAILAKFGIDVVHSENYTGSPHIPEEHEDDPDDI